MLPPGQLTRCPPWSEISSTHELATHWLTGGRAPETNSSELNGLELLEVLIPPDQMTAPACAFNLMINFRTMKRRGLVQAIAIAPSTGPLLAQTQTNQQPATQQPPAPLRGPVVGQ